MINKFPETRQAVLLEAKAQQIQASDNLQILQQKISSMKNNSEASEETKQQVLDELESLRAKQIAYIQESFSLIYNFSQMVNKNLDEMEEKPNELTDCRSKVIQDKLKKYEALIA